MWAVKDVASDTLWDKFGGTEAGIPDVMTWPDRPSWFDDLYAGSRPILVEYDSEGEVAEVTATLT